MRLINEKQRFGDTSKLICNIDKAKKELKWYPKFSFIKNIIRDEIWWNYKLKSQLQENIFINLIHEYLYFYNY